MVTQIYKIRSEIWVAPSPVFGGPKTSKFRRDFGQLRDSIAKISGKQQDIVSRKMALQTTDTPAQANLINSMYFGLQMAKNRTGVLTHQMGGHQAGQCHAF